MTNPWNKPLPPRPDVIPHSPKFYGPKICTNCNQPFQGTNECPNCPTPLADR